MVRQIGDGIDRRLDYRLERVEQFETTGVGERRSKERRRAPEVICRQLQRKYDND